ncbi:MAG: DUF1214 domain-containing protein [Erythrobacter sp.]|uniref:DUF1214 domain-containing protein n=1 Tax=Erythrobacter sp. TaxID=1042 RepID=UPI00262189B3|nr:DUF1214 domain-containing protein [Erythrobacter sp.]MDJ0979186.1 DUF1214 domain-containing protein [Erythrobacter sp.]
MIRYGFALLLGAAFGVGSALYMAGLWPGMKPLDFGTVEIDGWRSDFAIGSEAADPYTRARVARHGLLALAKSEAVYFTTTTDSEGRALVETCDYRVTGGSMPSQWWSLTLYRQSDSMLPMNTDEALSIDATSVGRDGDAWSARVSSKQPDGERHWISSKGAEAFDLMLRLYVPSEALLADPETALTPPVVERLSCAVDAA